MKNPASNLVAAGQTAANKANAAMMLLVNRNNPTVWQWAPNLSPSMKDLVHGGCWRKDAIAHPAQG